MLTTHQFEARVRRFSVARRGIRNRELACALGVVALITLVAGLLLLAGWLPNAFVNLLLAAAVVITMLVLVVRYWRRRERYRSPLKEAFIMEELVGGLRSRLVSAWDFMSQPPAPLTSIVIARAEQDLALDYEAQLDRREERRRRKHLLLAGVVLIAVAASPWFGVGRAMENLRHSWLVAWETLFPVDFEVTPEPGRHLYEIGERVELRLQFSKKAYPSVDLVLAEGDEVQRLELAVDESGTAAYMLSRAAESEVVAHFEFGQRQSERMLLVFTSRPELINMQTELVYPGYTRVLPRTLEGIQQRLVGLAGTRITLGFTFSKQLQSASITWDDGETLPLELLGRFASTSLIHNHSRQGSLQVIDQHGLGLTQPVIIDFLVQADEPPSIRLPRHLKEDMPMLPEIAAIFGFGVEASDDYGVSRCVLHWQKVSVDNPTMVQQSGEIERLISPPRRRALVNFDAIFEGMNLVPGDKLVFYVEAFDNRTPEAQRTRSPRRSLFIHQQELAGLNISELGFGRHAGANLRIAKARRATSVKEPPGQRTAELVSNTFEANIDSAILAPTIGGQHQQATRDYFRILSNAVPTKEQE